MRKTNQNFRKWLFSLKRHEKRALQIIFDALIVPATFLLAYYLRIEETDFLFKRDTYTGILIALASVFGVYSLRGFYHSFMRHIVIEAAYSIAIGSAVSCAALLVGSLLWGLEIPRSVPIIFALFLCVFSLGMRLFIRTLGQSMAEKDKENVAIYGAGAAGVQLMEALRQSSEFRVVLFIDDNPELDGKNLGGVLIYSLKRASTKIKKLKIGTLLLAIPSNIETVRQRVFNLLPNHPLRVKTIPSISSLIYGGSTITDLKEIRVEDLLGRAPVQYNYDLMAKNITGKNILITGAGGSIGSELCRQIIQWRPNQIILLDVSEFATYAILEELRNLPLSNKTKIIGLVGSVQDRKLVKRVFDRFEINTVYHTAAYKHVPLMEQNVMQCIENNVFGTLNLAEAASTAGVQNFILVSTDKAVNPTNFMGASKRLAELICQTLQQNHQNTRFSIVRFGNVLGSSGSVVPLFKRQIENGGPITLSHPDVTRYFMTMREAAQLVIQAGSLSKGGDVFVLDMGQPVKILDLAKKMITLAGLRPTWDGKGATQDGKIRITISGLRPGEKMFEELAYGDHLLPTVHPRINTSVETAMSEDELKTLLDNLRIALLNGDHEALYETIACVSLGVASINSSTDSFLGPRLENDHSPSQTYLET